MGGDNDNDANLGGEVDFDADDGSADLESKTVHVYSPEFERDPLLSTLNLLEGVLVRLKYSGWFRELCCNADFDSVFKAYDPDSRAQVLKIEEKSNWLSRNFFGGMRAYTLSICNNAGQEIVYVEKPLHLRRGGLLCLWCGNFFFQCSYVYAGLDSGVKNRLVGIVREEIGLLRPTFTVCNSDGEPRYKLVCHCSWVLQCCSYTFDIIEQGENAHDEPVGFLTKSWHNDLGDRPFRGHDNFFLAYPPTALPSERATLLAAAFMISTLIFEKNQWDATE